MFIFIGDVENNDFEHDNNNATHRCNRNSQVPRYNQTLHISLCGREIDYNYKIMIRGVIKILLPSSQKFSADAFNDMENTSKKEISRYKLVEGGWTSPVIANYTCYTKTSKFLTFIRKCYQSFDLYFAIWFLY